MGRAIDLTGKKFGRLTVISRNYESKYINGEILWNCICNCARKTEIQSHGSQLRRGAKKSCGCFLKPDRIEFLQRIKSRLVEKSKLEGQCIVWTGFKNRNGYGTISSTINGKGTIHQAHRLSWIVHYGDIPNRLFVCHHCDNPSCIRPDHLFLGTHTDNMRDKVAKGRCNAKRGETNHNNKITETQAREILSMKGKGVSSNEICKKYGIAASSVRSIWQRLNWKHLDHF